MTYPDENKKIIDKILIDFIREKSSKKISNNLKYFTNQRDTIIWENVRFLISKIKFH